MLKMTIELKARLSILATIYFTYVVVSIPGEIQAALLGATTKTYSLVLFQTAMTLMDGIGGLIIFSLIVHIKKDFYWIYARDHRLNLLLTAVFGFCIGAGTEISGVHILKLWYYPTSLVLFMDLALGALVAWTIMPPVIFNLMHSRFGTKEVIYTLIIIILLIVLGEFVLS